MSRCIVIVHACNQLGMTMHVGSHCANPPIDLYWGLNCARSRRLTDDATCLFAGLFANPLDGSARPHDLR